MFITSTPDQRCRPDETTRPPQRLQEGPASVASCDDDAVPVPGVHRGATASHRDLLWRGHREIGTYELIATRSPSSTAPRSTRASDTAARTGRGGTPLSIAWTTGTSTYGGCPGALRRRAGNPGRGSTSTTAQPRPRPVTPLPSDRPLRSADLRDDRQQTARATILPSCETRPTDAYGRRGELGSTGADLPIEDQRERFTEVEEALARGCTQAVHVQRGQLSRPSRSARRPATMERRRVTTDIRGGFRWTSA